MNFSVARALRACCFSLVWLAPLAHAADAGGQPLTLQHAIGAALQTHPELQSFAFKLRALEARQNQAKLRPAPEVSVELENFFGTGEASGLSGAEATFALSQVIELGDKRAARIDAVLAERDVLGIQRQTVQLDVLAEVTRRFIALAQRQEQLALARRATALADQTVAGSRRRVDAAKSPHAELDRALIARDRLKLEERAAEVDVDTARKQLSATWGESPLPDVDARPFGEVRADLYTLPEAGEFRQLVDQLQRNPDFLLFATEARLRDAEVRLALSQRQADVSVSAGLRRLQGSRDQAFVASFSMPLFAGKRNTSYVAEAVAKRELLDAERRIAEVKAQATLYELHRQMQRAIAEAKTLKDEIQPRSAEALKETEYAYERGRYSYLELVDAQREYLEVQAALIEAAATAHTLRVEIERLINAPLVGDGP